MVTSLILTQTDWMAANVFFEGFEGAFEDNADFRGGGEDEEKVDAIIRAARKGKTSIVGWLRV